jgi:hypothetical protein
VYKFKTNLISMITLKAIKPVLKSILEKNGIKKIQKTVLYMDRMMESGWV